MQLRDFDLLSGKEINPPKIIWEEDDRYAIIAFLLLSVDGKMSGENPKKLDPFMGVDQTKAGGEDDEHLKLQVVRGTIIREGGIFLDSLDRDESYCDYVLDEIDRMIEGNEKCGIGDGFAVTMHKELPGAAYMIFEYVKLLDSESGYSKNQKRILKHLAQKWDVDKSVLTVIEEYAKTICEIDKRRYEVENSDMPHREAVSVLSSLEAEEKAVWKKLNALNIAKDRATSAYVTHTNAIADAIESLGGNPARVRIRDEDEPEEYEDEEEESLSDRIGDSVVEGIHKVADIICAPFEWMTDKIIERM